MTRPSKLASFWTLVILGLCWLPKKYVPGQEEFPHPLLVMNLDKYVHMGIFAVFGFFWMQASESKNRAWWVFLSGSALAVITEIGQANRIVNRDANVADALADIVGLALGMVVFWLIEKIRTRRRIPVEI